MPGAEYLAWEAHLARHPPGDHHLHGLIASLCTLVSRGLGGKGTPEMYAPWLSKPKASVNDRELIQQTERMVLDQTSMKDLKKAYGRVQN